MRVVGLAGPRRCQMLDKPMPRVRRDYALVKVHVAPMCNEHHAYANWDFRDRNRPDSLGHEAAGEVVEVGPASRFQPGDRVVALCGYPCGVCELCRTGAYAHCPSPENPLEVCASESGECCFAEYTIKPDWLLVPIPDGMSYEHASMTCCGLGATFTAMTNLETTSSDTVLVTGLGPVGLGAVVNAVTRGSRVIGAGRSPYRSRLALELGAEAVLDPRDDGFPRRLRELTWGRGPDCVIECSAAPMYQRLALDAVSRRGRVAFLGESAELSIHVDRDVIQKGVTLTGSLDLYLHHAPALLRVIATHGPLIDRFVTHRFSLHDVQRAWELQLAGACGKVLLRPWQ
jgi:L-iditol 2-dehydrogenase